MGVCTTCWIILAQSQHTILQLDLDFVFVFAFEKVKKDLQANRILFLYGASQRIRPELGYELVTSTAIPRDCRALSTGYVEGRRKMYLRKDTIRWKTGEGRWIQVSRGDRKEHCRRLYQQLLLASEFRTCVCVCECVCDFAFRYTPSLRSVVARVFFRAITSEGIRVSSGGNKWHWVLP